MTTLFSGIYTASLTPLTSSYEPNLPALVSHVEQLFESGSDGVAILGSTGEANSLTIEQRLDIISYCGRTLAPERLMMGTGSCALQDAIRLTQASIEAGVCSVLVIPPFYYKPQSEESIIRFYSELIASVNDSRLRIIFYNFPKFTGYNFDHNVIRKMKQRFGKIAAGIKDSSGNWSHTERLIRERGTLNVFVGHEGQLERGMRIGASGAIAGSANILPEVIKAIVHDDNKEPNLPLLIDELLKYPIIPAVKALIASRLDAPAWLRVRPPLTQLASTQIKSLGERLDALFPN